MVTALLVVLGQTGGFDGCKVSEPDPGMVRIDCDAFRANASAAQPASAAGAFAELVKNVVPAHVKLEPKELTVAGSKRKGWLGESKKDYAAAAIVPYKNGKIRLLTCTGASERDCAGVLDALAEKVPPPNVAAAARDESWFGKKLEAPAGCKQSVPYRLDCKGATLTWRPLAADDPKGIDWLYGPLKKGLEAQGKVKEVERPCKAGGESSGCRELELTLSDGRAAHVLAAVAAKGGKRQWAQCNTTASVDKIPPPCDLVFQR